jgi:hypothetical protein
MSSLQQPSDLFNTVPSSNYLGFYDKEGNYPERVVKFLKLDVNDVSKATGFSKTLVGKMPKELVQRIVEIGNICELVANHFHGDTKKTALWFQLPNPLLGDVSPRDMIRVGRYKKLFKIVTDSLLGHAA